jgi:hypothetical protein
MNVPAVTACSRLSRLLGEPLAGTAPVARSWVLLEQPGPWGRKALTQSHLDPVLGGALEDAAADHRCRVALIRRPGRHPDPHRPGLARHVWIASTRPGASWLVGGRLSDVAVLGDLPWDSLGAGDHDAVRASVPGLEPDSDPLLLVCTNGRRDVCCASFGRPVVTAVHERLPGRVWETTHLGGHRFAPTCAVLPYGVVHGRMDDDAAGNTFAAAREGRVVLDGYRGRSTFEPHVQAAEAAVRQVTGSTGVDDLDVATSQPVDLSSESWQVVIAHADGRRWRVGVTTQALEPPRPESCTGQAVQPIAYLADEVVLESADDAITEGPRAGDAR